MKLDITYSKGTIFSNPIYDGVDILQLMVKYGSRNDINIIFR